MVAAGFSNPVLAAQSTFRAVLDALARPGTVHPIAATLSAPKPLSHAAAAIALSLCDHDTPVWLDADLRASEAVTAWLRFHCGCELTDDTSDAAFAFATEAAKLPAFDQFGIGTTDYPDRSTTIVLQVRTLNSGRALVLSGPGIRGRATLQAEPLPDDLATRLVFNRGLFPRGVDLLLVTENSIAALPRSVRVMEDD